MQGDYEALAIIHRAKACYQRAEYNETERLLNEASALGFAEADYLLGLCHLRMEFSHAGRFLPLSAVSHHPIDVVSALQAFRRAIQRGHEKSLLPVKILFDNFCEEKKTAKETIQFLFYYLLATAKDFRAQKMFETAIHAEFQTFVELCDAEPRQMMPVILANLSDHFLGLLALRLHAIYSALSTSKVNRPSLPLDVIQIILQLLVGKNISHSFLCGEILQKELNQQRIAECHLHNFKKQISLAANSQHFWQSPKLNTITVKGHPCKVSHKGALTIFSQVKNETLTPCEALVAFHANIQRSTS